MITFHKVTSTRALSDCGDYELRAAKNSDGRPFYNGWHVPIDKHIEASYDKEYVKAACQRHSEVNRESLLPLQDREASRGIPCAIEEC